MQLTMLVPTCPLADIPTDQCATNCVMLEASTHPRRHPHRPMCYLLCYVGGQHAPKETSPQPTLLQEVGADVCAVLHHLSPGVQGVRRAEGVVQ